MFRLARRRTAAAAPLALLCALAVGLSAAAAARAADLIQVETAPMARPFALDASGAVDTTLEPSGVAPIDALGQFLLVVDDKVNGLVIVDSATGVRVGAPLTSDAFPKAEAKWEAIARDSDGRYYVIGSHTGRSVEELAAHSYVVRFSLKAGVNAGDAPFAIDPASVARFGIGDALKKEGLYDAADPSNGGRPRVKIEGLAVREARDAAGKLTARDLVVGLREPDDPVVLYAASLLAPPGPAGAVTPLPLRKAATVRVGRREGVKEQLAALEYVPAWKGYLAVTSTEDADNAFHGCTLYFVPDPAREGAEATAQRVWVFGPGAKAEGVCVLRMDALSGGKYSAARLALVFDNDPARTKKPSLWQLPTLVRWPE